MTTHDGHLLMERTAITQSSDIDTEADPVLLEVFNNLFMSIAEQMGARLESTAQSVNIKERLDFSCALFDPDGNLVANAPHIPVHLGSMGTSVKEVIDRRGPAMRPGDTYAVNDPYHGGTHLPDVTVITPVFDTGRRGDTESDPRILFYVASRGHHAEIGGIAPGSMPADSRSIDEEGVLFDNWLLTENGRLREEETLRLLTEAPYPSRNPATNLADLRAQIAANQKGVDEVARMIENFGLDVVQAYMRHVQDNAEEAVRRVIDALDDGECTYETDSRRLHPGTRARGPREPLRDRRLHGHVGAAGDQLQRPVRRRQRGRPVCLPYAGRRRHSPQRRLPAPLEDHRPARLAARPEPPAAVVAGNVETSQAITGALYAALGVQAEGSGTMNNVTFGNARHQYYETLASGSGAGDGFPGASAVQTHMTNSRLTDPEILEWRLPVRLDEFAVRHGSGGAGKWHGGDGAVRRIRFLEHMTVSTLSQHRRVPPYGMAGGAPGALGANRVERADGTVVELGGSGSADVGPGDVLVIETPGGGGYGTPPTTPSSRRSNR